MKSILITRYEKNKLGYLLRVKDNIAFKSLCFNKAGWNGYDVRSDRENFFAFLTRNNQEERKRYRINCFTKRLDDCILAEIARHNQE